MFFWTCILLWLPCLLQFSLNFSCFKRVFLNEKIDDNSWNIDHVLQTTRKWSNWRLTREQDGTNVSFISHIHVRFLSCVISLIVLPTLPSSPSAVLLKLPKGPFTLAIFAAILAAISFSGDFVAISRWFQISRVSYWRFRSEIAKSQQTSPV